MRALGVASLCLTVALVVAPRPAHAQGPGSSVGSRIAELEARVTALDALVAALDGRADKLESGAVEESDLIGTYAGVVFALDLTGAPQVQTETSFGRLTLNADYSAEISGAFAHCALTQPGGTWAVACDPSETGQGSATGVWFIDADGSLVVQDPDTGDDFINDPNFIGAGGRIIISGGTGDLTGNPTPEVYSLIQVLIKLPPTPPPPTPTN